MNSLKLALLALVGLINFLPVIGLLSAARLQGLYGLPALEPNLALLLRHRALLFGLIGALILCAVYTPALRPAAYAMALISMAGFIVLAHGAAINDALQRVVLADWIGLGLLALVLLLGLLQRLQD